MSAVFTSATIKLLPSQLANQIAAGEVIERPASVVKELIENALDAHCTRVDIELVNGGMTGIMITDNGNGIVANELPLAISRHATSKIDSVEDLLSLQSLGFRGEALASMCSVSEWTLISRHTQAEHAAQLSSQHPEVLEINHAVGTCMTINNLFHNTPARRKFLRAERTEQRHCEEVIKRQALARFDVGFYLKNNGKQGLRLPAVSDDIGRSRRVAQICSQKFISQSLTIDYPRNDMRLWGWISQADFSRQSTDLQYFYINGRIIRDRVINHAIRLAYQSILPPGRHAVYVLHLDLDPASVDVNVHPTKHEVRFAESRLIHDFISRSLRDAIGYVTQDQVNDYVSDSNLNAYSANAYNSAQSGHDVYSLTQGNSDSTFGTVLSLAHNRFAISQRQDCLYIIDIPMAHAKWIQQHWLNSYLQQEVKSQPLLIPERLTLPVQSAVFNQNQALLFDLGLQMTAENNVYLIRKIPNLCSAYVTAELCLNLLEIQLDIDKLQQQMTEVLLKTTLNVAKVNLSDLLKTLSEVPEDYADCWRELSASTLSSLFNSSPAIS